MPKNAGDKLRLFHLARFLEENTDPEHPVTIEQIRQMLARHGISASRQTLYADMDDLRLLGYDIICSRSTKNEYYLNSRTFDLAELKLMVDAVQSAKFIPGRSADRMIDKIGSLTSRYRAGKLKRQIYLPDRAESADKKIFQRIDLIHDATAQKVYIKFRYYDRDENKRMIARHNGELYTAAPAALLWDDENYYLIAFDKKEELIKHFRVDKIGQLAVTDEKYGRIKQIEELDLGSYSKRVFGMYRGKNALVKLICDNSLAGVIIDRFGEDITFFKEDGGRFSVNVNVNISPNFYSWAVAFGDKLIIASPEEVRKEFCALLDRIRSHYTDS